MEIITPIKIKFLPSLKRCEPAARDSTAIRAAKFCFRYYFLTIVCGYRKKEKDLPLVFGAAYHKFRDVLEKTDKIQDAVQAALKMWPGDPPVGHKFEFLTRDRLVKSCMVGYNQRKVEMERGNIEVIASEQRLDLLMKDGKTRRGGIADQFLRWNGKPWGRDFKASSKTLAFWKRKLTPSDSLTGYIWCLTKLAAEKVPGLILELLHNSRKEGPKIEQLLATRTPSQLDRWEEEQIFYEGLITKCREEDCWPMEEEQCTYCDMRSVCSQSSESTMISQLEKHFVCKPWDYKETRE